MRSILQPWQLLLWALAGWVQRELRLAMQGTGLESLPLYPEGRACRQPTARRVIDVMHPLSRHRIVTDEGDALGLHTDATPSRRQLMKLFGIFPKTYGRKN